MKQVYQSYRSGKLDLVEVPPPAVRPGGVLVRNAASLISPGTERLMREMARKSLRSKALERPDLVRQVLDKARREGIGPTLQAVRSRLEKPVPLGYSSAGVVLEVGEGVDEFQPGDPVACAGSGYASHAEVVFIPRNLCVKVPSLGPEGNVSFEDAASTTVGAIALQGVRLADVRIGEIVAVIGAGLVGLLTVQLLKAAGCRVIAIDLEPSRVELAKTLGAELALVADAESKSSGEELRRATSAVTGGWGVDGVIITAGTKSSQPVELAAELCREKGRVVVVGAVGMNLPRRPFYEKELELCLSRSYGPGRYDPRYEEEGIDYPYGYVRWTERRNMAAYLELVAQGKVQVQPLITHRFSIEDAARAYDLLSGETKEPFLGIIFRYPSFDVNPLPAPILTTRLHLQKEVARPSNAVVGVGLLGAGSFAMGTLLPAMKNVRGTELIGVCAATGLSARHAGSKFKFRYCTTDEGEVLNDPAVNTVVIATRHHLHARQVTAALESGKNVFCEKPLAINEAGLRSIIQAYNRRRSGILMVGYNRRFAPMARRLKSFLSDVHEPLVMHYRINAGYLPPDSWLHDPEQGGGRIIGEVCHFVDFLVFLTESVPTEVRARGLPNAGRYHDDNVVITLELADGSLGTITYVASGDRRFSKEHLEVFGGGVVAVLEDFRSLELVKSGRREAHRSRIGQDKGHRGEWQAFVSALQKAGPSPIPFEEAAASTLTVFRILDSLRSGRAVEVDMRGLFT